jgi:hypothetical protein
VSAVVADNIEQELVLQRAPQLQALTEATLQYELNLGSEFTKTQTPLSVILPAECREDQNVWLIVGALRGLA